MSTEIATESSPRPQGADSCAETDPKAPLQAELRPLPRLHTALGPDGIISALEKLARQGKLPEFSPHPDQGLFSAATFGEPFDHTLTGHATSGPEGTTLRFELALRRKMPLLALGVTAFTIWPGVWLTDSLLTTYFSWYPRAAWVTWAWYIPLTVLPTIWMLPRMFRKSRAAAHDHALELIERMEGALGATRHGNS
jgi:hypothetical protein